MSDDALPLAGRRIGVTADRRWQEQADLFAKRGAEVVHGPTMRTLDLRRSTALRDVTERLVAAPPDVTVATTGMGMRMWFEIADEWGLGDALRRALGRSRVVARGAKASSTVKGAGIDVAWRAPGESMAEIVEHLRSEDVSGACVAVQLFEPASHRATQELRALAGELVEVPLYQWALPDDPAPALALVDEAVAGRLDAVTFTSQPAVHHLFRLAERAGRADDLRDALNGPVLTACIGPVCAEAATEEGLTRVVWPDPNRLPAMVRQVAELLGPA